jgi:hypothetical protein
VAKRDDVTALGRVDAHHVGDTEVAAPRDAHASAASRKSPIASSTRGSSVG